MEVETLPTPIPRETMSWEVDARPDTSREVEVALVVVELVMLVDAREVTPVTDSAPVIWVSPCIWTLFDVVVATPIPRPPVIYVEPATDRSCAGEVVPMPRLPALVNRPASVKMPDRSVENARSPFPVVKFWVRMPTIAAVEVPFVTSFALKVRREAVEVADARLER